jgi:hypothetical protein
MKTAMLLALGLLLVGGAPQDGAIAQTAPPVPLAPPKASPPRTGARKPPAASPTLSAPAQAPNPALDYDGFSVGREDNEQAALTAGSRGARNGGAESSSLDPDDEALKRKLIICQSCR